MNTHSKGHRKQVRRRATGPSSRHDEAARWSNTRMKMTRQHRGPGADDTAQSRVMSSRVSGGALIVPGRSGLH